MSENRKRNFKSAQLPQRQSQRLLGRRAAEHAPVIRGARGPYAKRIKMEKKFSEKKFFAKVEPTDDMPGTSHGSGHGHNLQGEQGEGCFKKSPKHVRTEENSTRDRDFWFKCGTWAHTTKSCWFIPKKVLQPNDGSKFELQMKMLAELEAKRLMENQQQKQGDHQQN